MMKNTLIKSQQLFYLFLLITGINCNYKKSENKSLDYHFGKSVPETNLALFFPENLDKDMNIRDITFSKDYNEFYFTQITSDTFIMTSKFVSGEWTKPTVAKFSGIYCDFEPFISPDGRSLYFASKRPSKGKILMKNDIDIWKVNHSDYGWRELKLLDETINTNCMEYYPSISKMGIYTLVEMIQHLHAVIFFIVTQKVIVS